LECTCDKPFNCCCVRREICPMHVSSKHLSVEEVEEDKRIYSELSKSAQTRAQTRKVKVTVTAVTREPVFHLGHSLLEDMQTNAKGGAAAREPRQSCMSALEYLRLLRGACQTLQVTAASAQPTTSATKEAAAGAKESADAPATVGAAEAEGAVDSIERTGTATAEKAAVTAETEAAAFWEDSGSAPAVVNAPPPPPPRPTAAGAADAAESIAIAAKEKAAAAELAAEAADEEYQTEDDEDAADEEYHTDTDEGDNEGM